MWKGHIPCVSELQGTLSTTGEELREPSDLWELGICEVTDSVFDEGFPLCGENWSQSGEKGEMPLLVFVGNYAGLYWYGCNLYDMQLF